MSAASGVERAETVGRGAHEEPGRAQVGGRDLEHGGVVFDHEDAPVGQFPVLADDGGREAHTSG